MKGIKFKHLLFYICVSLVQVCVNNVNAQLQKKLPNIIIIIADDLGYADVETNDGWIATPNLNQLAADGIQFKDFHSSGTVCSPTRAGLMTGLYQYRVGVPGVIAAFPDRPEHQHGLDSSALTFPGVLKKGGYATAIFGKWHLGYSANFNPLHYGFDAFEGFLSGQVDYQSHIDLAGNPDWWKGLKKIDTPGYTTHLITNNALRFIEENRNSPFCLVIAHQAVHNPYQGPDDPPFRTAGVSSPEVPPSAQVRSKKESMKLMMQEMDNSVGAIRKKLKESGLADNTFIFFLSDNGGVASVSSNAPFRGGKGMVWEGGHRVPAIACWPGKIKPGTVSTETCISLDIMPTVLDVAGLAVPDSYKLDGVSLLKHVSNGQSLPQRNFFWYMENNEFQYGVRSGKWKLVGSKMGKHQLYDLSSDPKEAIDVSENFSKHTHEMAEAYRKWKQEMKLN